MKYLDMTSWSLGFFRTAVPALLLGGYYLVTRTRVFRGDYRIIALIGTLNALRIVLYYLGFSLTSI